MPNVRPDLLKRYYAGSLDGRIDYATFYADTSFDEYYTLERISFPGMTRQTAAERAHHEHLRTMTPGPEPEPKPAPRPRKIESISRLPKVDLGKVEIDPGVEVLVLDRLLDIEGFRELQRFTHLIDLKVSLSKSNDRDPASPPVALESVEVSDCSPVCFDTALRSTTAQQVRFLHSAPVSLEILDGHEALRELAAGAPLLRRLDRLAGRPLEVLELGEVEVDSRLSAILATLTPTLRRLAISATRPFGPEMLPDLATFPELRRVAVSVVDFAEHRDAWLSYAVARPQIDFVFARLVPSSDRVEVVEIHRGVEILRLEKGKKVTLEISGDLASEGGAEDNGALEERLREEAKAAKKKVKWSSEADTFVAQTADLDTARWVVDRILDREAPEAAKEAPAKKAPARKAAAKKGAKS